MASSYPLPRGNYNVPANFGGISERFRGRPVGLLTYTWDLQPMIRLAQALASEFGNADPAIRAAHLQAAEEIQGAASDALQKAVADRGRVQKYKVGMKAYEDTLLSALTSDQNRYVDISGFSVGYLDDIPAVAKYWRLIEEGTEGFIGTILYGAFINRDGELVHPTKDEAKQVDPRFAQFGGTETEKPQLNSYAARARQLDAYRFGGAGRGRYSVMVTREIPAYHYMRQGIDRFNELGGSSMVLALYREEFEARFGPGSFMARWGARYGGSKGPNPAQIKISNPFASTD